MTIVVLSALYVFLVAPVIVVCFLVMTPREPGRFDRAVADVERFVELRECARAERAETGSLDQFIDLRDEARKRLWQPSAGAKRPTPKTRKSGRLVPGVQPERHSTTRTQRVRAEDAVRVFVAGASGAIGNHLVPQLIARGHSVFATTRSAEKMAALRALGAHAVVLDGLDPMSIEAAIAQAEPDVVVHQMTALAGMNELRRFDRGFARTNELRTKGTDYLLSAAKAAGARRFVAQSYTGWPNAREGGRLKTETDALDPSPPTQQAQSLAALRYLERTVLEAPLAGIVLRYGNFYGRGASDAIVELVRRRKLPIIGNGAGIWSWIHAADAAAATVIAIESDAQGIYNIVDDDPAPVCDWLPCLAQAVGAKPPRRVPVWLGRLAAGDVAVSMMTRIRGSSNAKAKRELGWQPEPTSWRLGFKELA